MASVAWDHKVQDCNHYRYKKQPGLLGVEIEAEGDMLPPAVFGWDVHKEGSLRGEAKEYVTVGAVSMEELEESMELLKGALKAMGSRVDEASYRASTHIHVNMQRRTHREVVNTIMLFLMIEPVWMRLCGPTRDGNLFCLPSYDCGDMPEFLASYAESIERYNNMGGMELRGKYASLNTQPLQTFGTLEFRTFPCSVQKDKVLEWAGWCSRLVEAGSRMRDPMRTLETFYGKPQHLLYEIFGPVLVDMFNVIEITDMVEIGAENAYESIRAFQKVMDRPAEPVKPKVARAPKKNMEQLGMVWNPVAAMWQPRPVAEGELWNGPEGVEPIAAARGHGRDEF